MTILSLNFEYRKYQALIAKIDKDRLIEHNTKYTIDSKYHLYTKMTPCPFEGNLLQAKVILLLANPGIGAKNAVGSPDSLDTDPINHNLCVEGWGIPNLSDQGKSNWYRPRFKTLINDINNEDEWKLLSNKLAMIQVIPWASESYIDLQLPSRFLISKTVNLLSEKNDSALFVVMRRHKYWEQSLENVDPTRIIFNPNPRCSYITKGNFKVDWQRIKDKLDE